MLGKLGITKQEALEQFISLKQNKEESEMEFACKIQKAVTDAGDFIFEAMMRDQFINGLSDVMTQKMLYNRKPDSLKSRLEAAEAMRGPKPITATVKAIEKLPPGPCLYCKKEGHWGRMCPSNPTQNRENL